MKAKISPLVGGVVVLLAIGMVLIVWFHLTRTPPMPRSIQEIGGVDAMQANVLKSGEEHQKKSGGVAPASESAKKEKTGSAQAPP